MIRTSRSSSRVAASTRAATFTASPMTLKLSLPAPPTAPATTRPVLTPTPTRRSPASFALVDAAADLHRRAGRPPGMVGIGSGRAEHREQAVALELVDVASVARDDGHHHFEKLVERRHDLLGLRPGSKAREITDVREEDGDLQFPSLLVELVGEDVLGHLAVEVRAEGIADPLALGKALDHRVERSGELARLVARRHCHRGAEVAVENSLGCLLKVGERTQHRPRHEEGQLERDRGGDADGDGDIEPQRCTASSVRGERGDGHPCDGVDQRQRQEETPAKRDGRDVRIRSRRDLLVDVHQEGAQADLEREVVEHRRVGEGNGGTGDEGEHRRPAEVQQDDGGDR